MQQYQESTTQRRAGCTTWIAVAALVLALINLLWNIVQEGAWNARVGQATGNIAPQQVAQAAVPTNTPTPTHTLLPGETPLPTDTQSPTNTPLPTDTLAPTNTPMPTSTEIPPPTNTPLPRIGADVFVGNVRWHFHNAENLGNTLKSDNQFIDSKTTAGKFIRVSFDVENRSGDMLTYGGIDLVDSQGRTFKEYTESLFFIPDGEECSIIVNLNPNVAKRCTLIFEVAADAVGLKAHVGDLEFFGGDEAYIELGL